MRRNGLSAFGKVLILFNVFLVTLWFTDVIPKNTPLIGGESGKHRGLVTDLIENYEEREKKEPIPVSEATTKQLARAIVFEAMFWFGVIGLIAIFLGVFIRAWAEGA
jgi:hypothetical protein